jgi:hypothetical protein
VVVIATAWAEFGSLRPALLEREGRGRVVIDCWRVLPPESAEHAAEYVVLGKGELSPATLAHD